MLSLCVSCSFFFFFLMIRRPPRSTRTDTLFPYTTLFRSLLQPIGRIDQIIGAFARDHELEGSDQPAGRQVVFDESALGDHDAEPVYRRLVGEAGVLELERPRPVDLRRRRRLEPEPPIVGAVHRVQRDVMGQVAGLPQSLALVKRWAHRKRSA